MLENLITEDLKILRRHFLNAGFDIRFVGGCVRDSLIGIQPKDIDLCTDATPDEQIEIYKANNYRWVETGIKHGTVTVVIDQIHYEITSLRIDIEPDGRHSEVEYTRDWIQDLSRRDFSINAMSYTFDGELIDPYNGASDLKNKIVRFVGDPDERIKEDYLRILRWFRFFGRFGNTKNISLALASDDFAALKRNIDGIRGISSERIWSEMSKIISHKNTFDTLFLMANTRMFNMPGFVNFKTLVPRLLVGCDLVDIIDPIIQASGMCHFNIEYVTNLSVEWKWSNLEKKKAYWFCNNLKKPDVDFRRLIAFEDVPREWIVDLLKILGKDDFTIKIAEEWHIDPFPVSGDDLLRKGFKPDKLLGEKLKFLKEKWADLNYIATKEELLNCL